MKKVVLLSLFVAFTFSVALRTHVQASSRGNKPLAVPQLDEDDPFTCNAKSLDGSYGISIGGTRPVPGAPGTFEQVIGVGIRTFDGAGNFSQVTNEKGSVTGLVFPDRALQGTYSVNPDCSGTLTLNIPGLPFPIVYDIVVVSHGHAFDSIVASPAPVMVTTSGRRVN